MDGSLNVCRHSAVSTFGSSIHGVDYTKDLRKEICLTPPNDVISLWEEDYRYMMEHMIYNGTALPFDELIKRMHELEERFH